MELYITDNEQNYHRFNGKYKILFAPYQFVKAGFLSNEALLHLNLSLSSVEYEAASQMLLRLKADCGQLEKKDFTVNKFLATRNKHDRIYSLLYAAYWEYYIPAFGLNVCLTHLLNNTNGTEFSKVTLNISENYFLCRNLLSEKNPDIDFHFDFYKPGDRLSVLTKKAKNIYYSLHKLIKNPRPQKNATKYKKHLLLFLYDIPSVHMVMKKFIDDIAQKKEVFLSIIEITTGHNPDNKTSSEKYKSENIAVYSFQDFRDAVPSLHNDLYIELSMLNKCVPSFKEIDPLYSTELKYAWVNKCVETCKPDSILYLGVLEHGRAISDVGRYHNIPTINIDYAMFTDDPLYMESNIEFTYRACISQNSSDIWKRRGDPTKNHILTGFCKLDDAKDIIRDKNGFCAKLGLNKNARTVCFASTWAVGNEYTQVEKKIIAQHLSEMCNRNNWNFIVKKHPAESDTITDDVIRTNSFKNQVVLVNNDIHVYELLANCDLVCTQSSSIVTEALYFDVPFCYVALNKDLNTTNYTDLAKEKEIHTFFDFPEMEKYLLHLFAAENYLKYTGELQALKGKYLYKSDGLATKRLYDFVLNLGSN